MAVADVTDKTVAELISLSGRRAVVTGAAQGIGKGIARRLAQAGASVLIGDLLDEMAAVTARELSAETGAKVIATRLDVSDGFSIKAAAALATEQLGGIDIWVNNAGIFPFVSLLETSEETWDRVMDVNLRGVFLGSTAAARQMIAAGHGGVIINISSLAGLGGISPGLGAYVASKHGVIGAVRNMALEWAPHNIRVLGIAPGIIVTETAKKALASDAPEVNAASGGLATSKLGRAGTPDDIGRVVLFCASDLALFMTGTVLVVDAGETA